MALCLKTLQVYIGARRAAQRTLHRVARQGRYLLAELAHGEVEQRLTGLGLPAAVAVADDDVVAVDLHADGGQRSIGVSD